MLFATIRPKSVSISFCASVVSSSVSTPAPPSIDAAIISAVVVNWIRSLPEPALRESASALVEPTIVSSPRPDRIVDASPSAAMSIVSLPSPPFTVRFSVAAAASDPSVTSFEPFARLIISRFDAFAKSPSASLPAVVNSISSVPRLPSTVSADVRSSIAKRMRSFSVPASILSLPVPALIVSAPAPASIVSLDVPPVIESAPPSEEMFTPTV